MEKFVPFEKLSKKKRRELTAQRRGGWNGLNPVTRKPENAKAYNRQKARKWSDDSMTVSFVLSFGYRYSDAMSAVPAASAFPWAGGAHQFN